MSPSLAGTRTLAPEAAALPHPRPVGATIGPRVTPGPLRSTVVLTDCQSAPAAARCCLAPPGGSPGRPTGRGPISSRTRLAQNPGDRSLPLSTSPKGREGAVTANSFPEEGRNQGGLCVCAHVCVGARMHAHMHTQRRTLITLRGSCDSVSHLAQRLKFRSPRDLLSTEMVTSEVAMTPNMKALLPSA